MSLTSFAQQFGLIPEATFPMNAKNLIWRATTTVGRQKISFCTKYITRSRHRASVIVSVVRLVDLCTLATLPFVEQASLSEASEVLFRETAVLLQWLSL